MNNGSLNYLIQEIVRLETIVTNMVEENNKLKSMIKDLQTENAELKVQNKVKEGKIDGTKSTKSEPKHKQKS